MTFQADVKENVRLGFPFQIHLSMVPLMFLYMLTLYAVDPAFFKKIFIS